MDPLVFTIFGASGDLAKRKLIPAIFQLYKGNFLPDDFAVLGVSRSSYSDEAFREKVVENNEHLKKEGLIEEQIKAFQERLFYQAIDTSNEPDYAKVKDRLAQIDQTLNTQGNYIFYLSTPPSLYETIPAYLAHQDLHVESEGWRRLVIEKPFGYDEHSAVELNQKIRSYFDEDQIYRIDHYLGKETVQNLLVTRFANGIFEPLWNRNYIHHIEVTAAEKIGVGDRGGYYDKSGALRDMIQNHLLQVVAHVAMEPPITADAHSIRNEKLKLFQSIRPIKEEEVEDYVIRGQYIASKINKEKIISYRDAGGVPEDSKTETFVAMKFFIDNWRWADVPFYIRTGKYLPTKVTEIVIYFKSPPQPLFKNEKDILNTNNKMIIRIQPHEGLMIQFGFKVPGAGFEVKNVDMDFHYADLTDAHVPEAYERLLLDCIKGDATLYARGDSVEAAWKFVDPILKAWEKNPNIKLYGYPAGTWGPEISNELIEGDKVNWRNPCKSLSDMDNFCEL